MYQQLISYGESDVYPFHMPGHKRRALSFPNPYTIDITEIDGFDNLHHAEGLIREAEERAAKLYGLTPFARVQEISRAAILKLLDVGVMGLVIPDVRTVAEVEKIVEYGKYLPLGKRGVANTAGSGFWFEDYAQHGLEHYFEVSNRETMLLPQCETVECLEHLEEIVRVPGIDGIYVGPFDLSTALGKPAQFDDPEIKDAIAHIQGVCRAAGKFSFIYAADEATARADFDLGYDSVTMGMDATVLTNAFKGVRNTILG